VANTARVTQSWAEIATIQTGTARVTQSYVELAVGVGIQCGSPPSGTVGVPYSHTFPSGGGIAPLTFSITAGNLPNGLVLNASTGQVTGTPITAGTSAFTVTVNDSQGGSASVACSITIAGTIPPNVPNPGGGGGGGLGLGGQHGRATLCGRHKNAFDWCMFFQSLEIRDIEFPPMCTIPPGFRQRYPLPWSDDLDFGRVAVPEQAVPFSKIGSVVTPAPIAGDVVVAQERVPYGYDGLMMAFFTEYTGQGFEQGSGDIEWRIQLNMRFLKELGNLPFALGSSVSPCPLTEGQIVLSGQLMRLIVNVPNLSGNIQVGGSRILGGLIGFYWPR
jgi:hypothetical protein